jgi:hypothetical protein
MIRHDASSGPLTFVRSSAVTGALCALLLGVASGDAAAQAGPDGEMRWAL